MELRDWRGREPVGTQRLQTYPSWSGSGEGAVTVAVRVQFVTDYKFPGMSLIKISTSASSKRTVHSRPSQSGASPSPFPSSPNHSFNPHSCVRCACQPRPGAKRFCPKPSTNKEANPHDQPTHHITLTREDVHQLRQSRRTAATAHRPPLTKAHRQSSTPPNTPASLAPKVDSLTHTHCSCIALAPYFTS